MKKDIEKQMAMVGTIARQYANVVKGCLEMNDLVQEGYLGLLEAEKRFDREMGVRFDSYAAWWVRRAITNALSRYGNVVSVPRNNVEAQDRCMSESIDTIVDEDEGDILTYADVLAGDSRADRGLIDEEKRTRVEKLLMGLSPLEKEIVQRLFGIGRPEQSTKEAGVDMGLTQGRVALLRFRAIEKMQKNAKKMTPIEKKRTFRGKEE